MALFLQVLKVLSLVGNCRIFVMLVYLETLAPSSSLSLAEKAKVHLASHQHFKQEPFLEIHGSHLLPLRPLMHRVCLP